MEREIEPHFKANDLHRKGRVLSTYCSPSRKEKGSDVIDLALSAIGLIKRGLV